MAVFITKSPLILKIDGVSNKGDRHSSVSLMILQTLWKKTIHAIEIALHQILKQWTVYLILQLRSILLRMIQIQNW